jgi:hypothetical protein
MSSDQSPTPETHAAKFMPCNAGPGWTRTQWFVSAEFAENLERQRDEAREQCKYWKGVVRGARAELISAGRISSEEYAALCADRQCRDYVEQMDALKEQRDELLAALEAARPLLVAVHGNLEERPGRRGRAEQLLKQFDAAIAAVRGSSAPRS